jgi:hypothetical protein
VGQNKLELNFFETPTPYQENNTVGTKDKNSTPIYSASSEFYNNQLQLFIFSENSTDTIYYTLNGATPNKNDSVFKNTIILDTTSLVRAQVISEGKIRGEITTHSYFLNSTPNSDIVSILIDSIHLFDLDKEIFINPFRSLGTQAHH